MGMREFQDVGVVAEDDSCRSPNLLWDQARGLEGVGAVESHGKQPLEPWISWGMDTSQLIVGLGMNINHWIWIRMDISLEIIVSLGNGTSRIASNQLVR